MLVYRSLSKAKSLIQPPGDITSGIEWKIGLFLQRTGLGECGFWFAMDQVPRAAVKSH